MTAGQACPQVKGMDLHLGRILTRANPIQPWHDQFVGTADGCGEIGLYGALGVLPSDRILIGAVEWHLSII
jgi:hypothetical protein